MSANRFLLSIWVDDAWVVEKSRSMNPTYFGLLAEFGESEIPLERVCEKYFGLSTPKAKRRACLQQLPFPPIEPVRRNRPGSSVRSTLHNTSTKNVLLPPDNGRI